MLTKQFQEKAQAMVLYRAGDSIFLLDTETDKTIAVNTKYQDKLSFVDAGLEALKQYRQELLNRQEISNEAGVNCASRPFKVGDIVTTSIVAKPIKKKNIINKISHLEVINTTKREPYTCMINKLMNIDGVIYALVQGTSTTVYRVFRVEDLILKKSADSIQIGDVVKVTETGYGYCSYDSWSGLAQHQQWFTKGVSPKKSMLYRVVDVRPHEQMGNLLACIQDEYTKQVYIMGILGIQKVNCPILHMGDKVSIIDEKFVMYDYSTWSELGEYATLLGSNCNFNKVYNVIKVGKHENLPRLLALIQNPDTSTVFIVDFEGLQLVNAEVKELEQPAELELR